MKVILCEICKQWFVLFPEEAPDLYYYGTQIGKGNGKYYHGRCIIRQLDVINGDDE